jgi:hypothetical protein
VTARSQGKQLLPLCGFSVPLLLRPRHELQAIGNNLNQIARHFNATGDLRDWSELREALALNRQWTERHIAALDRVLGSVGM